jgi:hypothetical protein
VQIAAFDGVGGEICRLRISPYPHIFVASSPWTRCVLLGAMRLRRCHVVSATYGFLLNGDFMIDEQVEQPKAVGSGQEAAPQWLENAVGQWKIYAGIAAVITIAIVGMWWFATDSEAQNAEAALQLSRIRPVFESGNFEAALNADTVSPVGQDRVMGLIEISQLFGGTDAGSIAALMAGNCFVNLGRFDEASPQFDIASSSGSQVVQVGSLQGLASCAESRGEFEAAGALYEQAGQKALKTGLEGQCYYRSGLCYEQAGNNEEAAKQYRLVANKYEISEVAPAAKSGLARLGMAID